MNDRIHRALDGDLSSTGLSRSEAEEVLRSRSLFDQISRSIPSQPVPRLGNSVVNRIASINADAATSPWNRIIGWFLTPKGFSIRPAYAVAMVAVVVIAMASLTPRGVGNPVTAPAATSEVFVHFRLDAPNASTVALAGDFSNWIAAHPMQRTESGVWTIVIPLEPGVHDYSFVVDGNNWVPDPSAPAMADGFGGMNSRIAVFASDAGRSL